METWEYLEVRIYPEDHYYTRMHFSRQNPTSFLEPPDYISYPRNVDFGKIDVARIAAAQGWEVVVQAPNRGYLFKRRMSDQKATDLWSGRLTQYFASPHRVWSIPGA